MGSVDAATYGKAQVLYGDGDWMAEGRLHVAVKRAIVSHPLNPLPANGSAF